MVERRLNSGTWKSVRQMRLVLIFLLLLAMLLGGAYLSLPALMGWVLADRLAPYGYDTVNLSVRRPTWDRLVIDDLSLQSESMQLVVSGAILGYHLPEVFTGKLNSVQIRELNVIWLAGSSSDGAATEGVLPDDLAVASLFDLLPAKHTSIGLFSLAAPDLKLAAHGNAELTPEAATIQARTTSSPWSSDLQFDLRLDREAKLEAVVQGLRGTDATPGAPELLASRATLTASPRDQGIQAEVHIDLVFAELAELTRLLQIEVGQGQVSLSADTTLPWPLPETFSASDLVADVRVKTLDWQLVQADARIRARSPKDGLGFNLREGSIQGGNGLRLSVHASQAQAELEMEDLKLDLATRQLVYRTAIALNGEGVSASGALHGSLQTPTLEGSFEWRGQTRYDTQAYSLSLNFAHAWQDDTLSVTGTASLPPFKDIRLSGLYRTATSRGEVDLTLDHTVRKPLIKQLYPAWAEVYDAVGGGFGLRAAAAWQADAPLRLNGTLILKDLQATYDDIPLRAISGEVPFLFTDMSTGNWRIPPTDITVAEIDVGFPVTSVAFNVEMPDTETLRIKNARAELLGGTLHTAPFVYLLADEPATLRAELESASLSQILELQGETISGTGTLDGAFPVAIDATGVRVTDGRFQSRPPGGVIRLSTSVQGTGQPGLDFALTALQDFRYTALSGDVQYTPEGDLTLGVKLLGNNPAVEKGRAIQYNLNITENIPVLLESLRLQDAVTKSVEKKVNRQAQ